MNLGLLLHLHWQPVGSVDTEFCLFFYFRLFRIQSGMALISAEFRGIPCRKITKYFAEFRDFFMYGV